LEIDMERVTVSPKFQVVIPRAVRERLRIVAGQKLQVITIGDRIELVPIRPMKSMRGFLKGLDPTFVREEDDCT
jgi:AbrB family looped-hinge helix DNA binding protein